MLGPGWSGKLETRHSLRVGWRQNQQNIATDWREGWGSEKLRVTPEFLSGCRAGHMEGVS